VGVDLSEAGVGFGSGSVGVGVDSGFRSILVISMCPVGLWTFERRFSINKASMNASSESGLMSNLVRGALPGGYTRNGGAPSG